MKTLNILSFIVIIAGLIWGINAVSADDSFSEIIFYVGWYDIGKSALEGLEGVKKVTKGFKGSKEINTVTYDPDTITPTEMKSALQKAGTYIGTVEE